MYVLTELGYVLICHVKEKKKKCSFENALVEKSESSTRNKNGLVEGLLLFSIHKKILGSDHNNTTLIISNDEMDDILKIVEDSGVLLKGVGETIQHEAKEQRGGFLSMLLGTLGASLLGDVLSKGLSGKGVIRAGERTIRAGYGYFLTPPHPLTNLEIQEYYQNEPRFNGV